MHKETNNIYSVKRSVSFRVVSSIKDVWLTGSGRIKVPGPVGF